MDNQKLACFWFTLQEKAKVGGLRRVIGVFLIGIPSPCRRAGWGLRILFTALLLLTNGTNAVALTEMPQLLQEGVPIRDLDGLTASEVVYRTVVPPGSRNLKFTTSGGWGDCDI